jgi:hypothetical protein
MAEDEGKPGPAMGSHPRAYIASKPNGGYVMKGRGKPSYTFTILFFGVLIVAMLIAAAT